MWPDYQGQILKFSQNCINFVINGQICLILGQNNTCDQIDVLILPGMASMAMTFI